MVFKICGYKLQRDTSQQVNQGKKVESIADARPGDLLFFSNDKGVVSHVGILIERNKVIHASGKVRIDPLTDKGIQHAETGVITHHLTTIKRILPE
jgi:cell wall-associated NlpC family hydrolase